MIKAVIFDFDWVIWDTYDINYTLSKEFDNSVTHKIFKDHHNGNVFEKPIIKFWEKDIPIFFRKQKELFTKNNFFKLNKVFDYIKNKTDQFIISSTIDNNIKYFLELGNYNNLFKQILWKTTHKSKIEKFKMIFKKYNLIPEECLFITDTIWDIIEAREVNVKTIAVTWWYHNKVTLESESPFSIVDNEEELLNQIKNII